MPEIKKRLYVKDEFYERYTGTFKTDKRLSVHKIENGILFPMVPSIVNQLSVCYGIYDENRCFCPASAMREGMSLPYPEEEKRKTAQYSDQSVIYGGVAYFHLYGHFLMESTARLWFVLQNPDDKRPIVFIPVGKPDRYLEFFDLLGIERERLLFIERSMCFKEITVPEMSSRLGEFYTEEFMLPFRKAAANVPAAKYKKVYLTRRRLEFGNTCDEEVLEKLFKKNGYKVISPERLSVKEQISLMKGAKSVVSLLSSATHNVLFCEKGTECVILNRSETVNKAQIIVNQAIEADWYYVDAYYDCFPVLYGSGPFFVGMTSYVNSFCKDKNMKIPSKKNVPDAQKFIKKWILTYGGSETAFQRFKTEFSGQKLFSYAGLNFLSRSLLYKTNFMKCLKLYCHLFRARLNARFGFGGIKQKYSAKVTELNQKLEKMRKETEF